MNPLRQTQESGFQKSKNVELHSLPDSEPRKSVSDSPIEPIPVGPNRISALKHLGATFEEGNHEVTKIATPIEDKLVPSFVDTEEVNRLARDQKPKDMNEIANEAIAE